MDATGNEHDELTSRHTALLEATRQLLHVGTATDVRRVTLELVEALGGSVTDDSGGDDVLPFDLSFGIGDALFPCAVIGTDARRCIEQHLPAFLVDAARALDLGAQRSFLADVAAIDPLTGLPNRSMLDRALQRLRPDDTIVMIDLEQIGALDEEHGDTSAEEVLRAFGRVLRATSRGRDVVGRYDGDEFVAVLSAGGNATAFLRRLLDEWSQHRPQPVTFAAGITRSDGDSGSTLARADQAIALAKEAGRGRWMWVPGGIVPDELGPGPRPHDLTPPRGA